MKAKASYRPATNLEKLRSIFLARCTLPPASMTKRFARNLADQVQAQGTITEKQANYLAVSCYRYRRQLPAGLAPDSPPDGYMTPTMRRAAFNLAQLQEEAKK